MTTGRKSKVGRNSPTGISWGAMMARCSNPEHEKYHYYGGAGVSVCLFLRVSPDSFVSAIGERPQGTSIDRINTRGNYSCGECDECRSKCWPKNIKWSTWSEQRRNQRPEELVEIGGVRKRLVEWASESGLDRSTISRRIKASWPNDHLLDPLGSNCGKPRSDNIEINGLSLTIKEWAKRSGVCKGTIMSRRRRGYSGADLILPALAHSERPHGLATKI